MLTRSRARKFVNMLVAALALYAGVLLLLILVGLPDRVMLWPQIGPIEANGAARVLLPWNGNELEIWTARHNHEPDAYILRFYGNADRADRWVADEVSALPIAAEMWGVNYPGFGGSTGPSSLKGIGDSALIAYDALSKMSGDKPILVFGTSMGTTAALRVAAERKVAGVFLHNPPALRSIIVGDHGFWNLWLLAYPLSLRVPASLDSIANAGASRAPAIFLMSGEDEIVRYPYQQQVFDAYRGSKHAIVLPHSRHNDPIPGSVREEIDQRLLQIIHSSKVSR